VGGGLIVSVSTDPASGDPSIVPTSAPALTRELSAAATWEKYDGRAEDWVRCDPPARHAGILSNVALYRPGDRRAVPHSQERGAAVAKGWLASEQGSTALLDKGRRTDPISERPPDPQGVQMHGHGILLLQMPWPARSISWHRGHSDRKSNAIEGQVFVRDLQHPDQQGAERPRFGENSSPLPCSATDGRTHIGPHSCQSKQ
jgi:hypothetical protein